MEPWLVITLLISSVTLLLWSVRELTRWYLRLNILEDKIDHLHKMLIRIEQQRSEDLDSDPKLPTTSSPLFLIKDQSAEEEDNTFL